MKTLARTMLAGLALSAASIGISGHASAAACDPAPQLPARTPFNSVTFGDGVTYSLPILGLNYQSSPGQIQNCIVVFTGPNGGPVTNNGSTNSINNAFETPSGTATGPSASPFFRTGDPTWAPDPTGGAKFAGDTPDSWDIRLSALSSYLNGGDMIVMFNHNQTNSGGTIDQDLFIWAQIRLVDTDQSCKDQAGAAANCATQYFYVTSTPNLTGLTNFGTPGGDPYAYTGPQSDPTNTYPSGSDASGFPKGGIGTGTGSGDANYMVRARGQICTNAQFIPVPCSGPHTYTFNENLGANNVANAVFFPEIQDILNAKNFGGYDVLQADIRMGCNPLTVTGVWSAGKDYTPCPDGSVLNNGYEQAFIVAGGVDRPPPPPVPEPGPIALMGLSLALLYGWQVRRGVAK